MTWTEPLVTEQEVVTSNSRECGVNKYEWPSATMPRKESLAPAMFPSVKKEYPSRLMWRTGIITQDRWQNATTPSASPPNMRRNDQKAECFACGVNPCWELRPSCVLGSSWVKGSESQQANRCCTDIYSWPTYCNGLSKYLILFWAVVLDPVSVAERGLYPLVCGYCHSIWCRPAWTFSPKSFPVLPLALASPGPSVLTLRLCPPHPLLFVMLSLSFRGHTVTLFPGTRAGVCVCLCVCTQQNLCARAHTRTRTLCDPVESNLAAVICYYICIGMTTVCCHALPCRQR